MACWVPLKGYRSKEVTSGGKHALTFNPMDALSGSEVKVPCGQCSGCRADRASDWATRCSHEAKMHERNCFLTLTYDDEHVPADYSVRKRDLQLFNKRLREKFGAGIKHFGCGEYGDRNGRPHYHEALFNFDFPDKKHWRDSDSGYRIWRSELLEQLWPNGLSEIGSVTHESGGYIAKYCFKKVNGDGADAHYWRVSPVDGQFHRVEPEFMLCSLKPALGKAWFDKFSTDAFPSDFVVVDGRRARPPQYYLRQLEKLEAAKRSAEAPAGKVLRTASAGEDVRIRRGRKARAVTPAARANSTEERLAVREEVQALREKRLVRSL